VMDTSSLSILYIISLASFELKRSIS